MGIYKFLRFKVVGPLSSAKLKYAPIPYQTYVLDPQHFFLKILLAAKSRFKKTGKVNWTFLLLILYGE